MAVKLRKYQRFFHFSHCAARAGMQWSFTARRRAQGPNPRRSNKITCRQTTLTQRITIMAMKKKTKKKKAAKKS
jgi:hypothetical protein